MKHPHVVELLGAGFTPLGRRFLLLEHLSDGTLGTFHALSARAEIHSSTLKRVCALVCVLVCVCARERDRESQSGSQHSNVHATVRMFQIVCITFFPTILRRYSFLA